MRVRHLVSPVLLSAFAILLVIGCEAPGVGDPCRPENVPEGGFKESEAYLETSSVQCQTRVCMVYKLAGNTERVLGEYPDCDSPGANCVLGDDSNCDDGDTVAANCAPARVYCTCRCDAPAGSSTTTCECPDGYACEEVVATNAAGAGVRGSYCVKKNTVDDGE